jgi:3-methyladenine DNA glycosylase/8-oxoguanine DNA glycosylase
MLRLGARDPTMRLSRDELLRSTRTPDGPATLAMKVLANGVVDAGAWGPGADHVLDGLPALLGEDDDRTGFDPEQHPTVARADHRLPGLRIGRTGDVEDALVPTILGQRVTGLEASRSWASLVRRHGEPAPGPQGLLLRPPAEFFTALPGHQYARYGVEESRATTIREACRRVGRLHEAAAMPSDEADARLRRVPGLGAWTSGLVRRIALGDADAVEVGDFHVPNHVCWQLAGEPRGSDERMLELLAPFTGHRGRVVVLLTRMTEGAPKRGPRGRIVNTRTTSRRP